MSYANRRISDENLTDQVFGYRTVIRYKGLREGREYWECECRCGKVRFVQAQALKSGKAKSCGCFRAEKVRQYNTNRRAVDPWVPEMRSHSYHVKWDRENKNKPYKTWDLTLEDYKRLCTSPCTYCGTSPSGNPKTQSLARLGVKRGSIDRRDNSLGYSSSNCLPCCIECNKDKGTMNMCDFIELTIKRYCHLEKMGWLQSEVRFDSA